MYQEKRRNGNLKVTLKKLGSSMCVKDQKSVI